MRAILARLPIGNRSVNGNMIGAVVRVRPYGGEGLSGTGPKAGGPRYLHRFAVERTTAIDTTAASGNATLLLLGEKASGPDGARRLACDTQPLVESERGVKEEA